MVSKLLVVSTLGIMIALSVAAPVAQAWDPGVGKCVWIINGPTMFSRACVDTSDKSCPVYTERWYWEGGYSKTCV